MQMELGLGTYWAGHSVDKFTRPAETAMSTNKSVSMVFMFLNIL